MRFQFQYLRQFISDTRGAVTVDYVMLAAAVTGVTLMSTDIIQNGLRSLAGTVDSELKGEAPGSANGLSYANSFDNGSAGWSGAYATNVAGIGNVLGPIENTGGGPGVSRDFEIDPATDRATFSFDLLAMDDFDGDTGTVYVDGEAVGSVTANYGVPTFTAAEGLEDRGIIVRYSEVDSDVHLGGNSSQTDSRSTFEITVRNDPSDPRGTVNIGFGSDATAGAENEFFAIDNFQANGLAGS